MNRVTQISLTVFAVCLSGCSSEASSQELSKSNAKSILEAARVDIVRHVKIGLSPEEEACAIKKGLFQKADEGYYTPTEAGMKLNLNSMDEPGSKIGYSPTDDKDLVGKTQLEIVGNQSFLVDDIKGIVDDPTRPPGNKVVAATAHVKVQHECFAKPLKAFTPMRAGNGEKTSPTVYFKFRRYADGWRVEFGSQEN